LKIRKELPMEIYNMFNKNAKPLDAKLSKEETRNLVLNKYGTLAKRIDKKMRKR